MIPRASSPACAPPGTCPPRSSPAWPPWNSPISAPDPRLAIGNDLVDLSLAGNQGKHRDARFVARVFNAAEQALIVRSGDPERLLWSLWAAKEAVYKIAARTDPAAIFAHQRFEVQPEGPSPCRGLVRHQDRTYHVHWEQRECLVHAWAYPLGLTHRLAMRVAPISGPESASVRNTASELLADCGLAAASIVDRPPVVVIKGRMQAVGISLAHDGAWGAVVLSLPEGACQGFREPTY